MRPATTAPMIERYSSENWVACHDARNAMRPNEIGFGRFVIVNLALMIVLSMGLQHPQRNGTARFWLLGEDVVLNSFQSLQSVL